MLHNEQEKVSVGNAGNILQVTKYVHGVGDSSNPLVSAREKTPVFKF